MGLCYLWDSFTESDLSDTETHDSTISLPSSQPFYREDDAKSGDRDADERAKKMNKKCTSSTSSPSTPLRVFGERDDDERADWDVCGAGDFERTRA